MVATAFILKVDPSNPRSVVDLVSYYTGNTSSNYYTESGDPPGVWTGKGAEALGLTGVVTSKALRNLFMGKSPDGRKQLVKVRMPRPGEKPDPIPSKVESEALVETSKKKSELHVPGYDLTLSVPKSVTAFWVAADEPMRRLIERVIDEAAREALGWFENNLTLARRGKGGERQELAGLVIAMFDHTTARNTNDPQLHRHCVIANVCQGSVDGKWSKVNSQVLLRWVRTLGPMFRNTVLQKLSQQVGVEAYRPIVDGKPAGWFELRGIFEKLTDKWSSRRKEILRETEVFNNHPSSTVKARQNANLRTRKPKEIRPQNSELSRRWKFEAQEFGQTEESLKAVIGRRPQIDIEQRVEKAITDATKNCLSDRAYFSRHKFIQRVSEELQDVPISGVEVVRRSDLALQRLDQFRLIEFKELKEPVYTSIAMWNLEKDLLRTVDEMKKRPGPKVSTGTIDRTLQKHSDLSTEQAAAVRHLLQSPGTLKCLSGVAGAGKTRTLDALKDAFVASGYKVAGTAISGAAKEELAAKAKIETRTVASYKYHLSKTMPQKAIEHLKHHIRMYYRAALGKSTWRKPDSPRFDRRTVLFFDEMGMADTKHTRFILKEAQKAGATVIGIGDDKQLSPIGPGGPFQRIVNSVPTVHLSENFRQRNSPEDAQAAADLREGDAAKMLESYAKRGRLVVAKDREQAAQKLVTEWAVDGNSKSPEKAIILTQTREEARSINQLCQMERRLAGNISDKSVRINGVQYHVGDRVMFHEPMRRKGIENGYQGTVSEFNRVTNSITIKLDREPTPQQKKFGRTQTVTLKTHEMKSSFMTLGYAATTHKMQGQSRQRAYCLVGGSQTNQELMYVQITRGEESTKLFTDRHHAGKKLVDLVDALKTSGKKDLAHDLGQRLRIRRDSSGGSE